MGVETGISWTDHTFNPWWGCTKVSPGCDHCYAETFDKRVGGAHWGKGEPRRTFGVKHWNEPLKWSGRIFCGSMCDIMDDEAPAGEREKLWELIDATPNLTWQLLTKRPHRYHRFLPAGGFQHGNVWLGTTTENQELYDVRWPILHSIGATLGLITFISYEPAIGPLSIAGEDQPDWVIFGGETGAGRRSMETKWAENVKAECDEYGSAFFMKQMSAQTPIAGKALIPITLQVHDFPA